VAHGVDPAVKEVETPDLEAILDRARAEAESRELRARHDPMLPSRQFGQRNVGCGDLTLTMRVNTPHPTYVGAPDPDERGAATLSSLLNAQFVTNAANAPRKLGRE
jgi:hypothetical protein